MKILIENQDSEDQVNLNEQEEIQGGSSGTCYGMNFADEDSDDNVAL